MKFLPVSEADRKDMLAAIGAPSVDALFASIPSEVRREPGLPPPLSEIEIRRFMGRPAPRKNAVSRERRSSLPRRAGFIAAMRQIAREAEENPDIVLKAPHTTPVKRVDEVAAARNLILRWRP